MPRGRTSSRSSSRKRSRVVSRSPYSGSSASLAPSGRQTRQGRNWPAQTDKSYLIAWDPFPAVQMATLRYSTVVTLAVTIAGTPTSHLFRANSIYDPDFTGIGHQPYGYDTYASIYNHYEVLSSRIVVKPTQSSNFIYGIAKTDDATISADYDTIREQKGTNVISVASGTSPESVTNYYDQRYFPNKFQQQAGFNTDVVDPMFYQVFLEGNSSASTVTISFLVNITYNVRMAELRDLGQS